MISNVIRMVTFFPVTFTLFITPFLTNSLPISRRIVTEINGDDSLSFSSSLIISIDLPCLAEGELFRPEARDSLSERGDTDGILEIVLPCP